MVLILLLVASIVSAAVCYFIAKKRGADPFFWGTMGILLGPFAIPFVYLGKRDDKNS